MAKKIILYKKMENGSIRLWSIHKSGDNTFTTIYGKYDGSLTHKDEHVPSGKGGRTLSEQIMSRMASKIQLKLAAGYVNDIEVAKVQSELNFMKLKRPMLAKPLVDVVLPPEFLLQYKYDGNRCLITKRDGEMIAYSRGGKRFQNIDHIIESAKNIPEGTVLDGELYHHGTSLQRLRSWIARKQDDNKKVVYMCYDMISDNDFPDRLSELYSLDLEGSIYIAPTKLITGKSLETKRMVERLKDARNMGYEGLIARGLKGGYRPGKRSDNLIKIKSWRDEEFTVYDVKPSRDGWGILCCQNPDGRYQFKVSAPGNMIEKTEILKNKSEYIGRLVTVEYANLTEDGIPFQPIAIAFRDH